MGSFISTAGRESTCAQVDFSVEGVLIAGINGGVCISTPR